MKVNVEELKTLVEAGDEAAIIEHVYASLEDGDVTAAAKANKDVLREVDSLKDTHHNTALETFKKKQVPKLIEAAVLEERQKHEQTETPEQIKIRELETKFEQERLKSARATVRAKLIELATGEEVGLDASLVNGHIDRFIPNSFEAGEDGEYDIDAIVEAVKADLVGLSTSVQAVVTSQVEQAMKGAARNDIGGGLGTNQQRTVLKGEELAKRASHADAVEKQSKYFK